MWPILLFSDDVNFLYLTKRTAENAFLIFREGKKKIYTFKDRKELERKILKVLKNDKAVGVNFNIQHKRFLRLKKLLKGKRLYDASAYLNKLRSVKNEREIKLIKKASKIADEIFSEIPKMLSYAKTELALAKEIKKRIIDYGSIAFEPIVAVGKNSLQVHHKPENRKISKGKILLVDLGLSYKNYCCDITKCFAVGYATKNAKVLYEKVYDKFFEIRKLFIPGINTKEILERVRELKMPHALAHSIGIEVHEEPVISEKRKQFKLKRNMVFALEPALYSKKLGFGVRLETEIVVRKKPKILTKIQEEIPTI